MRGKTTKIAAATVILVSILVLTILILQTSESVVLAGVLERVKEAGAFSYKVDVTMTGSMFHEIPAAEDKMNAMVIISDEYGMKMEMDMGLTDLETDERMIQQTYILPDQKMMLILMPQDKQFMRMELNDDLLTETKKENRDPREMMKQILDCDYIELGRSEINGVEVEGFETIDPNFSVDLVQDIKVKLWVDVETWLPVQWEMDMTMDEQMSINCVITDFQWDIQVAASEFEPVIPDDYTSMMNGDLKMPSMTEEAALEGLKLFAETSGKYPKTIDMMGLMEEYAVLEIRDTQAEDSLSLEEELEYMKKIQIILMLHMQDLRKNWN